MTFLTPAVPKGTTWDSLARSHSYWQMKSPGYSGGMVHYLILSARLSGTGSRSGERCCARRHHAANAVTSSVQINGIAVEWRRWLAVFSVSIGEFIGERPAGCRYHLSRLPLSPRCSPNYKVNPHWTTTHYEPQVFLYQVFAKFMAIPLQGVRPFGSVAFLR